VFQIFEAKIILSVTGKMGNASEKRKKKTTSFSADGLVREPEK
jgi:hypothetical protein